MPTRGLRTRNLSTISDFYLQFDIRICERRTGTPLCFLVVTAHVGLIWKTSSYGHSLSRCLTLKSLSARSATALSSRRVRSPEKLVGPCFSVGKRHHLHGRRST